MNILSKIKTLFVNAIKEHPFSISLFMLAMILSAGPHSSSGLFKLSEYSLNVLDILENIFLGSSAGALLCESIHLYRRENNPYGLKNPTTIICYCLIMLVTAISSYFASTTSNFDILEKYGDFSPFYETICFNCSILVFGCISCLIIYFFYKRSKETFESYLSKAFCGFMKGLLIYIIIAAGIGFVLLLIDTLIFNTDQLDLIWRVETLLLGLVFFPCAIAGLSKTDAPLLNFSKNILSYVFTSLLAISYLVVYIYIIKIIVLLEIPNNEVFHLLSFLFGAGIFTWTMAQGCCDDNLKKPLKLFPYTFVPFIILQIVCIGIRLSIYGFTPKRYFGVVLIIFEIAYFVIYTIKIRKDKDLIANSLFVIIAILVISLLVPGINVSNVVTVSQKHNIEKYLDSIDTASIKTQNNACSAYYEIRDNGGLAGYNYLYKKLSSDQLNALLSLTPEDLYDETYSEDLYD